MYELQARALDHPRAPERAVGVPQCALAPVLHGREGEGERAVAARLPPVVLLDALDPVLAEPGGEPKRDQEERSARGRGSQAPHRVQVEMVVVVVRDEDHVDARQLRHVDRQRHDALRPRESDGRGARGEVRVDEDVAPGELDQECGVADPGRRRPVGIGPERRGVGLAVRKAPPSRRRLGHAPGDLLPLPAPEALLGVVRIVVAESVLAVRRGAFGGCVESERSAGEAEHEAHQSSRDPGLIDG